MQNSPLLLIVFFYLLHTNSLCAGTRSPTQHTITTQPKTTKLQSVPRGLDYSDEDYSDEDYSDVHTHQPGEGSTELVNDEKTDCQSDCNSGTKICCYNHKTTISCISGTACLAGFASTMILYETPLNPNILSHITSGIAAGSGQCLCQATDTWWCKENERSEEEYSATDKKVFQQAIQESLICCCTSCIVPPILIGAIPANAVISAVATPITSYLLPMIVRGVKNKLL